MNKLTVKLSGLTCEACAKLVKRRIEKIDGVENATVLNDGTASIVASFNITKEDVRNALSDTEYKVL